MSAAVTLRQWVKARRHPLADAIYRVAMGLRQLSLPMPQSVGRVLYTAHVGARNFIANVARICWWTPLFQSRLETPAPGLLLYGGMPLVIGRSRDAHRTRLPRHRARPPSPAAPPVRATPVLEVGDNVDIGWQTTIAVGRRSRLGNNVRIAGRAFLAGYPGHPLDAADRARRPARHRRPSRRHRARG